MSNPCKVCGKPATSVRGNPAVTPPVVIEGTELCGTHSNTFNRDWGAAKGMIQRMALLDAKSGAIPRVPTFLEMVATYFKDWSEAHARRFKGAAAAKTNADPRGTCSGLRSKAGRLAAWIRRAKPRSGESVMPLAQIKLAADMLRRTDMLTIEQNHARFLRMEQLVHLALPLVDHGTLPQVDWRPTEAIAEDHYALPADSKVRRRMR